MNFVLIPGFMTDRALWRDMEESIRSLGEIIYGDLSYGQSLQEMALSNIAVLPDRFILVGFSLGGYVGRWIASLVPERIDAMILIASSNKPDDVNLMTAKHLTAKMVNTVSFGGLSTATIRSSLHDSNKKNTTLIEFIRSMSLRLGPDVFVRQLQLQRNSPVSLTGTVNFPVLIVASASDELRTLSEAEALHSDYPASVLHVIENAGHMLPLEQPDKLMQVIKEWLHDTGII